MGYEHARFLASFLDSAIAEMTFEWEKEIDPAMSKQELKDWIENHEAKEASNRVRKNG